MLPDFLDFLEDKIIVGHNLAFIFGFLSEKAKSLGLKIKNAQIDTWIFAMNILDLESYGLYDVASALEVEEINYMWESMTAQVYLKLLEKAKEMRCLHFEDLNGLRIENMNLIKNLPTHHVSILAKNEAGIREIQELVFLSNQKYFYEYPRIPLSILLRKRENFLIGSACECGMIGRYIWRGESDENLEHIASMYDYLEVQPIENYFWRLGSDDPQYKCKEEDLIRFNQKIISIGEKMCIPVVATSDAHFLRPEDAYKRAQFKQKLGYELEDFLHDKLFFRTTEEMKEAFLKEGLSEEKVYKIVVTNSNYIADQIEKINLHNM